MTRTRTAFDTATAIVTAALTEDLATIGAIVEDTDDIRLVVFALAAQAAGAVHRLADELGFTSDELWQECAAQFAGAGPIDEVAP